MCTQYVTHEDSAMSDATFTFRVEESLKADFVTAAKANDRSAAQLLPDFMCDYVAQQHEVQHYDAWLTNKVEQSRTSVEGGKLISGSDVEARFAARRVATRARIASTE